MPVIASLIENTYSDWLPLKKQNKVSADDPHGFTLSITGTYTATITLQRRFNDPGGYSSTYDVATYTANAEYNLLDYGNNVEYRIGIKTGGYTSGTAVIRLGN